MNQKDLLTLIVIVVFIIVSAALMLKNIKLKDAVKQELDSANVLVEEKAGIERNYQDSLSNLKVLESELEGLRAKNELLVEQSLRKDESLSEISRNMLSINNVFANNQLRGAIGEVQLSQILSSVFGPKNDFLYKMQYEIEGSNGARVDAAIFPQGQDFVVPIDSKFPLSGFSSINHESLDPVIKTKEQKDFARTVLARIKEISSKYIIEDVTSPYAIMFIPSEAVYAYICAYHFDDVLSSSFEQKVVLTGPNTLVASMLLIQSINIGHNKNENAKLVEDSLNTLSSDFGRFNTRSAKLYSTIESAYKEMGGLVITSKKLGNKFDKLKLGDVEDADDIELLSDDASIPNGL